MFLYFYHSPISLNKVFFREKVLKKSWYFNSIIGLTFDNNSALAMQISMACTHYVCNLRGSMQVRRPQRMYESVLDKKHGIKKTGRYKVSTTRCRQNELCFYFLDKARHLFATLEEMKCQQSCFQMPKLFGQVLTRSVRMIHVHLQPVSIHYKRTAINPRSHHTFNVIENIYLG